MTILYHRYFHLRLTVACKCCRWALRIIASDEIEHGGPDASESVDCCTFLQERLRHKENEK